MGVLGGTVTARLAGVFPELRPVLTQAVGEGEPFVDLSEQLEEGQLHAGFLLLPARARLPNFVRPAKRGIPVFCGVGVEGNGSVLTAESEFFDTAEDLVAAINFPIYTLNDSFNGLQPLGAILMTHDTGEVFAVSTGFQFGNQDGSANDETVVIIWAQPDFPRPFPLWSDEPVEMDVPVATLEKVDFLPSPGVMVFRQTGCTLYWIENGVLYTVIIEYGLAQAEVEVLVNSLVQLQ